MFEPNDDLKKRMETVRITSPGTNWGSTVILGGQDITGYIHGLNVDMLELDDVPQVSLEINAFQGLTLELSALIQPSFHILPGWTLIVEDRDGRRFYSTVEEPVNGTHTVEPTV